MGCYIWYSEEGPGLAAAPVHQYLPRCTKCNSTPVINPLMLTLKLHSNGLLYSNTVIGTLAVDGWAVTFGTARRGLGGLWPRPVLSSLYQM